MTKDQLETLILANLAAQFDQLVLQYGAVAATPIDTAAYDAAAAQLQKLKDLLNILDAGLANLILQETRAAEYASD